MSESQINIEKFIRHCLVELSDGVPDDIQSEEKVREIANWLRQRYPMTDDKFEQVIRILLERLQVQMDNGIAVTDNNIKPWLDSRRATITPFYWERYRTYLIANKGWNERVVSTLGRVSDEILDFLGNPAVEARWQRRGLIMGDVQSGKTANYTSLCNKAMDAGYRVIVVLTGMQENLRKQTQERLDTELVGLESEFFLDRVGRQMAIGVGRVDPRHYVATFTSKANDFDQKLLNNLNLRITTCAEPVLFVVKKQKQRLEYLYRWLKRYNARGDGLIDEPLLLIDDEADNASVNTKSEDSPTAINTCIRKLLSLFTRTSYVGVTATPYANIFIDPESDHEMLRDDLFPKDFIYSLSPPSNYIGSNSIFGENAVLGLLCEIKDAEDILPMKHKKDAVLETLPNSLYEALGYFLLTNAVQDLRGQATQHRSMLINISRFNNMQGKIRDFVQAWLDRVKSDVQNYHGYDEKQACRIPNIRHLRDLWNKYDLDIITRTSWEAIQKQYLHDAIATIKIVVVNQRTGAKSLDYTASKESGLRVITIGGNSLSRGLTLEGLSVSYFYRNSQAYDTLLQMGRWFGYRSGYDDLCRIWMSKEAKECYVHITIATAELRNEIEEMSFNGLTPKDYGLMVRSHPENVETMVRKLLVTARNKMKSAAEYVHTVSVSGKLIETPRFPNNEIILNKNYDLLINFIERLNNYPRIIESDLYRSSNHTMWMDVPAEEIAGLVRDFRTDPLYLNYQADGLAEYIEKMPHLSSWDVVIPEGDGNPVQLLNNLTINPEERFVDTGREGSTLRINGDRSRVGSRPCTRYGLKVDFRPGGKPKGIQFSDTDYLIKDRKPLLLLHFIEMKKQDTEAKMDEAAEVTRDKLLERGKCLVAIGLGFPRVIGEDGTQRVRYVINKVKQQQLLEVFSEVEDDDI